MSATRSHPMKITLPPLTPEQVTAIAQALDVVISQSQSIKHVLTPGERRNMVKGGDKSQPFIAKALEVSKSYPDILKRSFSVEEMENAITLAHQLAPLMIKIEQINAIYNDADLIADSNAMKNALEVYKSAQDEAANYPGLEEEVRDMGKRFHRESQQQPNPNNG